MSDSPPDMEPTELEERLAQEQPLVLVDVREAFEREIADLPDVGQKHIPVGEIMERYRELDPEDNLVVYCRSGSRSASVAQFLASQGYEKVWNLRGGVLGWQEDVDPSLTRY